jgi:hypothetical protein
MIDLDAEARPVRNFDPAGFLQDRLVDCGQLALRDRKFADSPLKEAGFEFSIPGEATKVSRPSMSPLPDSRNEK